MNISPDLPNAADFPKAVEEIVESLGKWSNLKPFFKLGWFKHLTHEKPLGKFEIMVHIESKATSDLIKTRTHPETFATLTWYKLKGIYFLHSVPTIRDQNQQVLWCLVCVFLGNLEKTPGFLDEFGWFVWNKTSLKFLWKKTDWLWIVRMKSYVTEAISLLGSVICPH